MKRLGILLITGLVALCLGCGTQEEPKKSVTPGEVKQEAKEAAKTTKEYLAQQQEKYFKQAQEKLSDLDKKITDLQQKAKKETGELQKKLSEQADGLKKQADAVKEKLAAMRDVSGEAWEKIKSGVDGAITELEQAYKQAESESR
jgi:uncharacterized coiled-coil DUF342 family protein